ncbi:MAG: hypothetical protein ACR2F1_15020 [Nitrososphaeraceae archaeon]
MSIFLFINFKQVLAEEKLPLSISIPSDTFLQYENTDYDVKVLYPKDWDVIEGDREPGDFITNIVTFEPKGEAGLHRTDDFFCGDVCIWIGIDNSVIIDDISLETYLDEIINSFEIDRKKFEIIYYDTIKTELDGKKAYKLISEEKQKKKMYTKVESGVIYGKQVYIIEYKAMEDYYEQYLPIAEKMFESLKLPDK